MTNFPFFKIKQLINTSFDKDEIPITIQGRLHHSRKGGNLLFLILRQQLSLLQVVCFKKSDPKLFKKLLTTPRESILRIQGHLVQTPMLIKTTGNCFELKPVKIEFISLAETTPFQIEDLNQMTLDRKKSYRPSVSLHNRLNSRYLDLRSNVNNSIFKIRTKIEHLIRQFLIEDNDFTEIHTPKLINIPSESGSSVFKVKYFDQQAYLAQSPQLYKQMMINSDFGKVFEIGAVYRAEKSISKRHLCEFIGLDLEIELESSYTEVFDLIESLLQYVDIFLRKENITELELISKYYPGKLPQFSAASSSKIPVISFAEGVELLNTAGIPQNPKKDLNNENELILGQLVAEKFDTEIFWLNKYPTNLRPFYTMSDGEVSRSYDLIFRGQEIASGAQRIHSYQQLSENLIKHGLTPEHYTDYLNSFKYGSPPHAGIGIGLERLVALWLNIPDVHCTSLLPRDPERLTP